MIHEYVEEPKDRLLFRADLCQVLCVNTETVRRWLKAGKLPAPDFALSRKILAWRLSTLRTAGINLPDRG